MITWNILDLEVMRSSAKVSIAIYDLERLV